jgi:tetratricopeptide (TPR) repeat protein
MLDSIVELLRRANRARREKRLADARRDLVEAVAVSRRVGVRLELVLALKGLGQIERDLGNGGAAQPLVEEAVTICRELGDSLRLAHTVRHLGDIHRHAGRRDLAEPCYLEALTLYRGDGGAAPLELANAVRPLAILKHDAGEMEEAKRLFAEARDLYAAANVPEGVASCSSWLVRMGSQP